MRPLIKRIILRCTVLQKSCPPGPGLTTVMKPIPVRGEEKRGGDGWRWGAVGGGRG